jgi:DNA-binding NtrC family response regulator
MPANLRLVRVLVVDDERVIADTLTTILSARGYRARAAYDAEQAIALAAEFLPQALVVDVLMPGMDGHELSGHFARHHPACKVLLMSGGVASRGELKKSAQRVLEFLETCMESD